MVREQLLIVFLFLFSIIYGLLIYRGKATKGIKVSITVLLSAYLAVKALLESNPKFWGLLVPVLIFYLTEVGYYSYHLLLGVDLNDSSERRKKFKLDLKNGIGLALLLVLFEIVPLLAVYYATQNILLSATVGLGSGLFFLTLPNFDENVFGYAFDFYTLLASITTMVVIYGN
ncbi:hypothetical protein [Palaeococcus ferrophilus]|uniref:hypothetical protein n=1 Tax=Palaeococcus ferrophilus TaxID=83868 RepID=UPI00064E888E|nr:hypothetical protein [Palaeococcus ferrophilus]